MKITDVECLILDRVYPFVRVYTDEGIVGIGEYFRRQPGIVKMLVDEYMKPALMGTDPTDTEVRFRDMMRVGSAMEMGGAIHCAIASGEMIYTYDQYRDLILRGRVDILQPDIVKVPGFTEFARIVALASAFGKPITVHNTQPILSTVAHLHVCAVYPNIPYKQEYNVERISIRDDWPVLKEPLQVRDGCIAVPDGPGLGVELDDKVVKMLVER
jgi:L-alanine-DL-glutamate epimerase-like enolase superfamily enzyme